MILSNLSYRYDWADKPEAGLCDVAQIRLDEQGKGTLTMHLNNETDPFYLIVTTASGECFTIQV